MFNLEDVELIVAGTDESGKVTFLETPAVGRLPGGAEGAPDGVSLWVNHGVPGLPHGIGAVPAADDGTPAFPAPGGSRVMIINFPPQSAGKMNMDAEAFHNVPGMHVGEHDEPGMHRTDSVDYEFIVSGKIDIELPGGQVRTLRPGSALIMGGVAHAWQNRYDEPCIYIAVVIGASASH